MQAEFENYRKRVIKEQTALVDRATSGLVEQLLPVLDSFELALKNVDEPGSDDIESVRKGVELVYAELLGVLEKAGLSRVEAEGKPFDPNVHEAVMQDDGDGEPRRGRCPAHGLHAEGPSAAPGDGEGHEGSEVTGHGAAARMVRDRLLRGARRAPVGVREGHPRAYRTLAKQHHPDANPGNTEAEERFKYVSAAAYDVLGDADKRKEYDEVRQMVASGVGPFGGGGPGGFGRRAAPRGSGRSGSDEGAGFSDLLGSLSAAAAGAARWPRAAPGRSAARPSTSRPSCISTSWTPCTASRPA